MKKINEPAKAREKILPEYYVLLCARRYAATVKKLALATTDDERRQHRERLTYLLESGLIETKRERERRESAFPDHFRKAPIKNDGSIVSRAISSQDVEALQYAYSIPPIASVAYLSADDMNGLADMFEGWAQNGRTSDIDMARLLGWANGLRSLAETVGADYAPPEAFPGAPVSLLKFMANKMRG